MATPCRAEGLIGTYCPGEENCYLKTQLDDHVRRKLRLPKASTLRRDYSGCTQVEKLISEFNLEQNEQNT